MTIREIVAQLESLHGRTGYGSRHLYLAGKSAPINVDAQRRPDGTLVVSFFEGATLLFTATTKPAKGDTR